MFFGFGPAAIVMAIIMILALIGLIVCAKKQETTPAAKPAAILCMVVILVCAIGILFKTGMFGDAEIKKVIANEMVYARSAVIIPAKYIAEKYPGSKILMLIDREKVNSRQAELIDIFKSTLGSSCEILAMEVPEPVPDTETQETEGAEGVEGTESTEGTEPATKPVETNPNTTGMPPEELRSIQETMRAKDVNAVIARYPEATMIVTFVGLPRDLEEMEIWWEEDEAKKKKVVVLNGDTYKLKNAILAGQVVAAVRLHPKAKFDDSRAPSDPQAAFNQRYLLITPDNIQQILEEYSNIFMAD